MASRPFIPSARLRAPGAMAPLGFAHSRPHPRRVPRIVTAAVLASAVALPAFAAQTDITISMDKAPAAPRIQHPTIIGSIPGSPFLFTIPTTGQTPLTFAATGLPDGLTLDAAAGTISGTTPAAGSYPINLTVTNSAGSASGTLTLTAGSTLALTPPMGWNSYDSFYADVKESDVKAAAQAMKTYLQPYGWNTVVIDYLWYDPEQTIDANGRWLPSKSKYPNANGSDGFAPLAAQVHALGLSFGIHLMRGIPRKSFTANTPIADSTSTANQAGNSGDTCAWDQHMYGVRADTAAGKAWYDSIYKQYASWNVDFVKVDDMMNPYGGNAYHGAEVEAVHNAIVKTGRSIILSLSPGPNQTRDVASLNANANMWRTVNDFWDTNGLSTISDEFTASNNWANTSGITPGHWPDADMLPLGTIGNRQCAFSRNQQVMVMSLWSIMPSPLMFGGQPTKLAGDSWTLALLTNEEVLAVNQDALGARGKRVAQAGSTEVWAKDMSGGRKAVALFNRGTQDATVAVTFSQLGVTGSPPVRDLWRRADATGMTSGISVNVPHESALMYLIGDASGGTTGTGGSSGAGGGTGTGGRPGGAGGGAGRSATGGGSSGGATGGRGGAGGSAGGAGGGGGRTAAGGSSALTGRGGSGGAGEGGGSGGVAVPGSGGTPASGGSAAAGGALASGGQGSGGSAAAGGASGGSSTPTEAASSGCTCTVAARPHAAGGMLLLFAAATLAARARRRGRR